MILAGMPLNVRIQSGLSVKSVEAGRNITGLDTSPSPNRVLPRLGGEKYSLRSTVRIFRANTFPVHKDISVTTGLVGKKTPLMSSCLRKSNTTGFTGI